MFALGREAQAVCYTTAEHQDAVNAFLEQDHALMETIKRSLRPRSVAIVGASADTAKLTGRPLVYLEKFGFTGTIYPVNPRYQ